MSNSTSSKSSRVAQLIVAHTPSCRMGRGPWPKDKKELPLVSETACRRGLIVEMPDGSNGYFPHCEVREVTAGAA